MPTSELAAQGAAVQRAARALGRAPDESRRAVVRHVADRLEQVGDDLLAVNAAEVAEYGESAPGRDRLVLNVDRIASMASALREVADSPDPLFEVVEPSTRPNGLRVERVRVPLGVVGVVYENRPNVTSDVAGLCVRSGNAAFLRGSSSAQRTNTFIAELWHEALEKEGLPREGVELVADPSHETVAAFVGLSGVIDCLIPRGGPALIAAVREHARVPYVLDGDGNCHVYVDASAPLERAIAIVKNAKTSRPGVCNAAESLLVHESIAPVFLPALVRAIPEVELRADERAREYLPGAVAATKEDYATEFLDLILAVKVVSSLEEAIEHVSTFGTGHSEAIVTDSEASAEAWIRGVDAAAVLVNASTRFIDGGELGLGGEVGISTQKLHARGPMGLRELTCLKWVVRGEGQIR